MVSQSDLELFLQAIEALGTSKLRFTALDNLLEEYGLSYKQSVDDDNFIKASVWCLSNENPFAENYKNFLLEVSPKLAARYLVVALTDPARVEPVKSVLLSYGASRETVNFLVIALTDPARVEPVKSVLLSYGASRETANPLVAALANPASVEPVKSVLLSYGASDFTVKPLVAAISDAAHDAVLDVLLSYGASDVTVHPLVGALANHTQRPAASQVLKMYGEAALQFIRQPRPGSQLYEPLTTVIKAIRAQQSEQSDESEVHYKRRQSRSSFRWN